MEAYDAARFSLRVICPAVLAINAVTQVHGILRVTRIAMLTVAVADVFVMPPTSIEDMLGAIEVVNVAVTLLSVSLPSPRLDFVSRAGRET